VPHRPLGPSIDSTDLQHIFLRCLLLQEKIIHQRLCESDLWAHHHLKT
jgi:hypothetical protein